jgi:hypothetical protein
MRPDSDWRCRRIRSAHRVCALLAGAAVVAVGPGGAAAKDTGPTSIAAGFGSVWVGMGNGEVLRIDAALVGHERRLEDGAASCKPNGSPRQRSSLRSWRQCSARSAQPAEIGARRRAGAQRSSPRLRGPSARKQSCSVGKVRSPHEGDHRGRSLGGERLRLLTRRPHFLVRKLGLDDEGVPRADGRGRSVQRLQQTYGRSAGRSRREALARLRLVGELPCTTHRCGRGGYSRNHGTAFATLHSRPVSSLVKRPTPSGSPPPAANPCARHHRKPG